MLANVIVLSITLMNEVTIRLVSGTREGIERSSSADIEYFASDTDIVTSRYSNDRCDIGYTQQFAVVGAWISELHCESKCSVYSILNRSTEVEMQELECGFSGALKCMRFRADAVQRNSSRRFGAARVIV
jgi:hypothetical protein